MIPLREQLSMLWSGDLPPDEARALRERIETDPGVAAEWRRVCAAIERLGELPDELPAPPLRAPERSGLLWRVAMFGGPLLLAALALFAIRGPAPHVVLVDGAQWAEGDVRLLAGDAVVDVDGSAWVSVEPPAGVVRGGGPEEVMNRKQWLAGLAGAVVTVVVYEGTAVVRAGSEAPVVVEAGETHRSGPPAKPAAPPRTEAERKAHVAELQRQLADVQQALEAAQIEGAFARGQLEVLQGTPSEWPADVPEAVSPTRFREELEARLAKVPDMEVADVDCSEYPCVAAVHYTGDVANDDWDEPLGDALREWLTGAMGEGLSLSVNTSRFRTDDADERYVLFGAYTGDEAVGTRTEYRIDALVDELGQRVNDGAP